MRNTAIALVATVLLLITSHAYSESNVPRAALISYDYSRNVNFGTEYQRSVELKRNIEKQENMNWIKIWLRIHIFMPQNDSWSYPQQYIKSMSISDIEICNADENIQYKKKLYPATNAVPYNYDSNAYDDIYDDWDEYWNTLFPDWSINSQYDFENYWSQSLEKGESEWIFEISIEDNEKTDEEIDNIVNSLEIKCSVYADYCKMETNELFVENGAARHEIRYNKESVQFKADSFCEEDFYDQSEKIEYFRENNLISSNHFYDEEFCKSPEEYTLIEISITMRKQMPWAVCNVEASIIPTDTIIGIFTTSDDEVYKNDHWKNGFYTLSPISIIVKSNDINEQQLKDELKKLELYVMFSTEFVGDNDFSGEESIGYPGIRFTTQVDMTELLTLDEIIEKIGDLSDG